MSGRHAALAVLTLALGVGGGLALERIVLNPADGTKDEGPQILYWVAPMDPNFRKDGPGKSPMGMDLVPVYDGQTLGDPADVTLSPAEINAIGVRTALAQQQEIAPVIETVGFVTYNEEAVSHVHARIEGWVENLAVRSAGTEVSEGQFLFEIYGPRGLRTVEDTAFRQPDFLRVQAPRSGIVTLMAAAEGMYLKPETAAMTIADLSEVWMIVDVFERDSGRIRPDMRVEARFEHLPGTVFEGEIDYIYPELDAKTRTLPIRLRLDNPQLLLKPNMYGTVRMLPRDGRQGLTVPTEAVIRTGRAERVVVRTAAGTFRPRLVTTGIRDGFGSGDRTEILQGLAVGEEVVASAQFLLDSESALSAGMTRMAPSQADPAAGKGELVFLDSATRRVVIRHERLDSLDWPAMETRFTVHASANLDRVRIGEMVRFRAVRGMDGTLWLSDISPDTGVDATGTGVIHGLKGDGIVSISHDPIPDLNWPSMTMDLSTRNVDLTAVPLEKPIEFDLAQDPGGTFTIVAVRSPTGGHAPSMGDQAAETPSPAMDEDRGNGRAAAAPMKTDGSIDSINQEKRTALVTHGPLLDIGMPGMTMEFPLGPALDAASLETGPAQLSIAMQGGALILVGAEPMAPPMEADGTINRVDAAARMANITHGPLLDIGMPGMTMDFRLDPGIDLQDLSVGETVRLKIRQEEDFSLTVLDIQPASQGEDAP